jgi:hypothetical protein
LGRALATRRQRGNPLSVALLLPALALCAQAAVKISPSPRALERRWAGFSRPPLAAPVTAPLALKAGLSLTPVFAPPVTLLDEAAALAGNPVLEQARISGAKGRWSDKGKAVSEKAALILEQLGVKTKPGGHVENFGVVIAPQPGLSAFNDVAYRLARQENAELLYVPEKVGSPRQRGKKPAGLFNASYKRVLISHLDLLSLYPTVLHEARHARFERLLRQGDVRFFHFNITSTSDLPIRPGEKDYGHFLSLEELSTYPKTLRHLVQMRERVGLTARAPAIAKVLGSILETVSHVLSVLEKSGVLELEAFPGKSSDTRLFEAELPGFTIDFPSYTALQARRQLALTRNLLARYVEKVRPQLELYRLAWRRGDLSSAKKAAGAMIEAARAADEAFIAARNRR